jgi:hypothetical protein
LHLVADSTKASDSTVALVLPIGIYQLRSHFKGPPYTTAHNFIDV